MAVAPLFVLDMATLKAALRLSGAAATDASAIINMAVKTVRVKFYQELGGSRVAAILAMSRSDTPSTDDEVMRGTAESCEALWVKHRLLQDLPTVFMDGSGSVQQQWNEEGLLRDASPANMAIFSEKVYKEVQAMLDYLRGDEEDTEGGVTASSLGPPARNPAPGTRTGVFAPFPDADGDGIHDDDEE